MDAIVKTICKGSFVNAGSRSALFFQHAMKELDVKLFNIHKGFISSIRPQWKVRINIDMVRLMFIY